MNIFWLLFILGLSYPFFGQDYMGRSSAGYSSVVANIIYQEDSKQYAHYLYTSINLSNYQTNVDLIFTDNLNTRNFFQIRLSQEQRLDFLEALDHYKSLYNQAFDLKNRINEAISSVSSSFIYWWKTDSTASFISYDIPFDFWLVSQNNQNYQLVLGFPSITDSKRHKETIQPPFIYIDYDEVLKLEMLLDEDTIEVAFQQIDQN